MSAILKDANKAHAFASRMAAAIEKLGGDIGDFDRFLEKSSRLCEKAARVAVGIAYVQDRSKKEIVLDRLGVPTAQRINALNELSDADVAKTAILDPQEFDTDFVKAAYVLINDEATLIELAKQERVHSRHAIFKIKSRKALFELGVSLRNQKLFRILLSQVEEKDYAQDFFRELFDNVNGDVYKQVTIIGFLTDKTLLQNLCDSSEEPDIVNAARGRLNSSGD